MNLRPAAPIAPSAGADAAAPDVVNLFAALDQFSDAVSVHDGLTGEVLLINERAGALYGYTAEQARELDIGQASEGSPPYSQADAIGWIQRTMAGEFPVFEWRARRRSGELFWTEVSLSRVDLSRGPIVVAIIRDISQRKADQAKREEVEQRLRTIFETANAGIFVSDESGRVILANRRLAEMFGVSESELCARTYPDLVHMSDRGDAARLYRELMAGRLQASDVERHYVRADGSAFWGLISGRRIVAADGSGKGLVGVIIDATERREIQMALRESEFRFRSMIRSASDIFCLVSPELALHFVSPVSLEMTGFTPRDLVGSLERTVHPQDWPRVRDAWDDFQRDPAAGLRVEYRHIHRTQAYIWVEALARGGMADAAGMTAMTVRDISEHKRTEGVLQEARRAAEAAAEAKSAFLANMSHEIRTPLNAVVGLTYLLDQTPLSARQKNYLKSLNGALRALQSIVNDILDFSKIEAGRLELEARAFDLDDVFDELACVAGVAAGAKNLQICFDLAPDVPRRLVGDSTRLGQVLSNLCHNAIKFTHAGEVVVSVASREVSPDSVLLDFAVRDTGIGIAPDLLGKLFKPFSQIDASTTRRFGGSGLGLAICRSLVNQMGGDIAVDSAIGEGSAFRFTLRFGVQADRAPVPSACLGARVLVVDAHALTREVIRRQLEADGATVEVAAALPADGAQFRGFDLVVLDEAAWAAAAGTYQHGSEARCPPMIVTLAPGHYGDASLNDPTAPSDCGARPAGFLLKPVTALPLRQAVGYALAHRDASPSSPAADAALAGRTIMVVDDSPMGLMVSREVLERGGATVIAVSGGQAAIDALGEGARPDAVLMDLQMPELDGFETTRRIRAGEAPGVAPLPIIGLSANALSGTRERCFEAGMDDYISKPVDIGRLFECLASRGRVAAGEAAHRATASAAPAPSAEGVLPGVDLGELNARFDHSRETIARLFGFLLDHHLDAFAQFEAQYAAGDRAAAGATLHDMIGMAASLAAHDVLEATRHLQSRMRAGEELPGDLAALGRAFDELLESARRYVGR